jgi:hypothetical protein
MMLMLPTTVGAKAKDTTQLTAKAIIMAEMHT